MAIYNEATHPGSSQPSRVGLPPDTGAIIPSLDPRGIGQEFAGVSKTFGAGSFTRAPDASGLGIARYPAEIVKSLPAIGPSVAETVFNATPVSNITSILSDIPGAARRPIIPAGLRDRAASALPEGIRQRATVWARAVARFRSSRPTSGGRVSRE